MSEMWTWRPLGEVTVPGTTWKPRKDPRRLIRYVDVSAVSREELRIVSDAEHSADNAPSRARKIVKTGDTIFATVRPTLRRIAQIPSSLDGEIVSTAFSVLRPNPTIINPDFLYFAMQLDDVTDGIAAMQTGASYPAVRDSDVLSQAIPLPSLSDQCGIATALNRVRAAMLGHKRCEDAATNLKHASMHTLFTRGLRGEPQKKTDIGPVPESWNVVNLGALGKIGNGSTPRKSVSAYWTGGAYPWLTSAKVYDREIVRAEQYVTNRALSECHLPRVQPGAILIAITGQGKTLGHCAILRIEATLNQHLAYVTLDQSTVNSFFVRGYLDTQYEYLRQVGAGGGSTKGALTCGFLRNLPIPIPPASEQCEIVAILDAIDRKIHMHRRKCAVLEELFKALLHKLMTGEIRVRELELSTGDCKKR